MKFSGLLLLLLLTSFLGVSQAKDYGWWEQKHNWDGVTPWDEYMIVSPRYFGPNALPIPELTSAKSLDSIQFQLQARHHRMQGDQTTDLFTSLTVPFGKRMMVEGYVVALEHYQLDTLIRDARFARDRNPEGVIGGDIYFATHIGLIQSHASLPDLTLRMGLRTASGLHLENARYLDSPGYFFDLRSSKTLSTKRGHLLTVKGMIGFYAWQTNLTNHQQNDAVLYGLGLNWDTDQTFFQVDASGYDGYLNNGDHPRILRFEMGWKTTRFNYAILGALGSGDNLYDRFGFGITWKAPKTNWN